MTETPRFEVDSTRLSWPISWTACSMTSDTSSATSSAVAPG